MDLRERQRETDREREKEKEKEREREKEREKEIERKRERERERLRVRERMRKTHTTVSLYANAYQAFLHNDTLSHMQIHSHRQRYNLARMRGKAVKAMEIWLNIEMELALNWGERILLVLPFPDLISRNLFHSFHGFFPAVLFPSFFCHSGQGNI